MTLKSQIIELAHSLNIQKIGFTTADSFDYLRDSLLTQKAKGHTSGWEHQNLDERLKPRLALKDAKTIISIALAYPSTSTRPPTTPFKRGQFARASWGTDYHKVLGQKMTQLAQGMEQLAEHFHYQAMVDTGVLVDVAVAARAGLGFIGKNGLLISKEYGSWLFLGELVTNVEIAPDQPVSYGCGDCTRCIDFCPTNALLGDGKLNAPRCLSFQTQNKGSMPEEFRKKITKVVYGCDICQQVCPYNKGIENHFHSEMEADPELTQPELLPFLALTNSQFQKKYGHMAGSWRGKNPLQRNAIYALANLNDRSALPKLLDIAQHDPRDYMREAANWALQRLKNQKLKR